MVSKWELIVKCYILNKKQYYTSVSFITVVTKTWTSCMQILDRAYGINQTLPVFSLHDEDRLVIFYACAHVAVMYDHTSNSQRLLQVRETVHETNVLNVL